MGTVGWIWKHRGQGYLRIPVSQSLVWSRGMGDKSCNQWEISGSAGASAKIMSRRRKGERRKGEVGRKRPGERGTIRIKNMTKRRSVTGADRFCGTRMQLGHEIPCVGFKKSSSKRGPAPFCVAGPRKTSLATKKIDLHQALSFYRPDIPDSPAITPSVITSASLNHLTRPSVPAEDTRDQNGRVGITLEGLADERRSLARKPTSCSRNRRIYGRWSR